MYWNQWAQCTTQLLDTSLDNLINTLIKPIQFLEKICVLVCKMSLSIKMDECHAEQVWKLDVVIEDTIFWLSVSGLTG